MKSKKKLVVKSSTYLSMLLVFLIAVSLPTNSNANSWKWIAYGDTRTSDKSHRAVLQAIMKNSPDYKFIINVGDVVSDGTYSSEWKTWQKACDDILGGTGQNQVPPKYMACPGNHDNTEQSSGLKNWNNYLPGQVKQYGNEGRFFVFDYEDARFIVLDSDKSSKTGSQYTMLLNAIQNNPKKWLFTVWHHPIFDFGEKSYQEEIHDSWGIPLYKGGCDLMFVGHAHYYVRGKKLELNGQENPPLDPVNGTAQVVSGNGGAPMDVPDPNNDGNGYMVESHNNNKSQYGYTELTIDENTLRLRHYLTDGTLYDEAFYTPNLKAGATSIDQKTGTNAIPLAYQLNQNYPNPFNPSTHISYELPQPCSVKLIVYDLMGHEVSTLVNEFQTTGFYTVAWNARDSHGSRLPSSVYFYRIRAGAFVKTLKMMLVQ